MVQSFLDSLLDPAGVTPHGFCLLWQPWLLWSHVASDAVIGLAYFAIPVALLRFLRRRRDLVFRPVFALFAAFILLCGTTHWLEILTIWRPAYGLLALVKVATALVSVATAAVLWRLIPEALALPSNAQLEAANAALRASEGRHRATFLRSPMPLHILDAGGTITGVSDRWLDLLDYRRDAVVGRRLSDFVEHAGADAQWDRLLAEGDLRDAEHRFVRGDGAVLDVLVSAHVERSPADGTFHVLGALVDVTARKQAEAALRSSEERLRQTQKMEVLGQLAGGIAHDFNNVLQAVGGGVSLILRRAEDPAAVGRLARMVGEAAQRGSATTRRLLAFARRNELQAEPVDVDALLRNCVEILVHTLGADIAVAVDLPAALPPLLADRGELETVLVNLATNARDAMPAGGTLTFAARAETVSPADEHGAGLPPGDYIRLSAADTGTGMDAATLARAAEPFFTTKPVDKGTGLGLAMTRGFAQQSGGALHIASAPGLGTTVTLWLPQAAERAPAPSPADATAVLTETVSCRPRVLLVDDEPLVRAVLAAELSENGFDVVQAESAATALDGLDSADPPALLVTDLSMPGMDGVELTREVQRRFPTLRAIVLTGYPGETTSLAMAGALQGTFTLLRKPVSGADLADCAAALLKRGGAGTRPAVESDGQVSPCGAGAAIRSPVRSAIA